ncbi:MAG: response regulator [Ferruginibacter sp.]
MKNTLGPIIYVEDDIDDRMIFKEVVQSFGMTNKLLLFESGQEFLDFIYTSKVQPLLIVCDINMPIMNGFELRRTIMEDEKLKRKSIPFIFYTTGTNSREVELAYELTVQGYFKKPADIYEIKSTLKMIIDYWCVCKHPNN